MVRGRIDIKNEMTASFMANENLALKYGFVAGTLFSEAFSLVSFENILFDIISFILFVHEQIFDTHKKEVDDIIEAKMPHRPSWYRTKSKAFQYGFSLIPDTDKYDNTGFTDAQIEASKVIKYAAITQNSGQLLIKIATEVGGVLAPISTEVKTSFEAYILDVTDMGVKYIVVNILPDILLLNIQIFRDPLVLDSSGISILNGNYPVQDAINEYLRELPFNGELILAHLIDRLQATEGVLIPHLINAEFEAIDINTNAYLSAQPINVKIIPVSGYFTVPNFNNISYVV